MQNRRQFTRILFSINATLLVEGNEYTVSIHDISLKGALATQPKTQHSLKGKLGLLNFMLSNNESAVTMNVAIVYEEDGEIGLQCNAIDIESISHLRRLIELNLGDESQLHRELSQLNKIEV